MRMMQDMSDMGFLFDNAERTSPAAIDCTELRLKVSLCYLITCYICPPSWPAQCRVQGIRSVGGPYQHHPPSALQPIHESKQG